MKEINNTLILRSVSEHGKRMELIVDCPDDLKRDVFKSESSMLMIPEIELELGYGTLGGVYTTVEGLLDKIVTNLKENNPFQGDSSENVLS